MQEGTIAKLPADKKFGFINYGQPKDIFFHESELVGVTLAELHEGDKVKFEVTEKADKEGNMRSSAVKVSRI